MAAVDGPPGAALLRDDWFPFKAFLAPNGRRFDYLPRLVREVVLMRPSGDLQAGVGKVAFESSAQDALGDIPVRDVLGATHGTYTATMLPAKIVGRAFNLPDYLKRSSVREDFIAHQLEHGSPRSRAERRRIWRALRKY